MVSYNRYIYISFPSKRSDCFGSLLRFAVMHLDIYIPNRDRHDHPVLRNRARQCHTQGTVMCHAPSHATSRLRKQYVAT